MGSPSIFMVMGFPLVADDIYAPTISATRSVRSEQSERWRFDSMPTANSSG
jgi:hypothetical protein